MFLLRFQSRNLVTIMSHCPPILSNEELRAKRLERLGILSVPAKENDTTATPKANKAEKRLHNSSAQQVISLLSDDDDTNEVDEASPKHRQKQKKKQSKLPEEDRKPAAVSKPATGSSQPPKNNGPLAATTSTPYFSVATWNVWFGPNGDGAPYANLRMKAIVRELLFHTEKSAAPLWFIGFQEVVNELYDPLSKSLGASKSYTLLRQPTFGYGCALAVHSSVTILDHGWQPYSTTQQDRGLLWVRVRGQKHTIVFGTTHLESYCGPNYTGATQRAQQIQQIQDFLDTLACDVAIVNGDMNWDDERAPRSKRQLTDVPWLSLLNTTTTGTTTWTDTWLTANANFKTTEPGFTYDPKKNPMFGGSGNLQRRFDRCLIRGNAVVQLCSSERPKIIGQEALPVTFEKYNPWTKSSKTMPVAPSDHFGYICKLQFLPK